MGVNWQTNEVTSFTKQLLLYYLGEVVDHVTNKDDCTAPDKDIVSGFVFGLCAYLGMIDPFS